MCALNKVNSTPAFLITVLILSCSLVNCTIVKPSEEGLSYFVLEKQVCESKPLQVADIEQVSITLEPTRGTALLDSQRILFAKSNFERGFYQYSLWAESPALMMSRLLKQSLNCNPGFRLNYEEDSSQAQLLVQSNLLEFVHDISSGSPGFVRVSMSVSAQSRGPQGKRHEKIFRETRPALQYNSEGAVAAFNLASKSIVAEVLNWLSQLPASTS